MLDRGASLAGAYSAEVVEPLLARADPALRFSTARLGSGSDVLGHDDATSRDHDWGLRLTVAVGEEDVDRVAALLEREVPQRFRGLPTRFATSWDRTIRQRAEVVSPAGLARSRCGLPTAAPAGLLDWLSLTGQSALELTAGPVFRDDDRRLADLRAGLATLPEDVRAWAVASAWQRIAEELPFVGRTGERGDDGGSRLIAARIVQAAMRLAFLLERRWAPYSKWLGTAFAALPAAGAVGPHLHATLQAHDWGAREDALAAALDALAEAQQARGLPTLLPATEPFWDRPYRALRDIPARVLAGVEDRVLRRLPLIGLPEFWTDDVRLLVDHGVRRRMVAAVLAT